MIAPMPAATRAFASASSAAGRSRSANTFPVLGSISRFFFDAFCRALLMIFLRQLESRLHQFDVALRGFGSSLRLLLKCVQRVERASELHRVDGPVRASVEDLYDLQDPSSAVAL